MGRIDKGVKCDVSGCANKAIRSLPTDRVKRAGISVGGKERRVYLCHEHYKEFKKRTKKEKTLDKWRYNV